MRGAVIVALFLLCALHPEVSQGVRHGGSVSSGLSPATVVYHQVRGAWVRVTRPDLTFMNETIISWVRHWAQWTNQQWASWCATVSVGGILHSAADWLGWFDRFTDQDWADWMQNHILTQQQN